MRSANRSARRIQRISSGRSGDAWNSRYSIVEMAEAEVGGREEAGGWSASAILLVLVWFFAALGILLQCGYGLLA